MPYGNTAFNDVAGYVLDRFQLFQKVQVSVQASSINTGKKARLIVVRGDGFKQGIATFNRESHMPRSPFEQFLHATIQSYPIS